MQAGCTVSVRAVNAGSVVSARAVSNVPVRMCCTKRSGSVVPAIAVYFCTCVDWEGRTCGNLRGCRGPAHPANKGS